MSYYQPSVYHAQKSWGATRVNCMGHVRIQDGSRRALTVDTAHPGKQNTGCHHPVAANDWCGAMQVPYHADHFPLHTCKEHGRNEIRIHEASLVQKLQMRHNVSTRRGRYGHSINSLAGTEGGESDLAFPSNQSGCRVTECTHGLTAE